MSSSERLLADRYDKIHRLIATTSNFIGICNLDDNASFVDGLSRCSQLNIVYT